MIANFSSARFRFIQIRRAIKVGRLRKFALNFLCAKDSTVLLFSNKRVSNLILEGLCPPLNPPLFAEFSSIFQEIFINFEMLTTGVAGDLGKSGIRPKLF